MLCNVQILRIFCQELVLRRSEVGRWLTPTSYVGVLVSGLAAPLLIQVSHQCVDDGLSEWTRMDQQISCLLSLTLPIPTVVTLQGMNQQISFPLSLSSHLSPLPLFPSLSLHSFLPLSLLSLILKQINPFKERKYLMRICPVGVNPLAKSCFCLDQSNLVSVIKMSFALGDGERSSREKTVHQALVESTFLCASQSFKE